MTKEEYEEMRNTIDSVGKYFNSIEELTKVRDLVEEVDASNNMAMLESPIKLNISLEGICRVANEDITKYLDAETILYIRNAILRRLNGRIAFFENQIENINYTNVKQEKIAYGKDNLYTRRSGYDKRHSYRNQKGHRLPSHRK